MNDQQANDWSAEIFGTTGKDPRHLIERGVERRNEGDFRSAEALLMLARMIDHENWQPFYELGVLYDRQGRREEAIFNLKEALIRHSRHTPTIAALISNLALAGRHEELTEVYARINPGHQEALTTLKSSAAFARYIKDFPEWRAEQIWYEAIDERGGMLNITAVMNQITKAFEQRRAFALVRLGDGEGTWLHREALEEIQYGQIYDVNRQQFWNIWYGADKAENQKEFYETTSYTVRQLQHADVIGVPPLSWIKHEYKIASQRGVPGTLNAFRVAVANAGKHTKFTTQLIHLEMSEKDRLTSIIRAAPKVAILTRHPQMGEFFSQTLAIKPPDVMLLPGEPSRRHLHGDQVTTGVHFPDRYKSLMSDISQRDFSGTLVLVAGGILGKAYAMAIRHRGGVAVDIGSVADKMLGKKTRPGY